MPPSDNPPPYSTTEQQSHGTEQPQIDERIRLIVGVDFGTTYSGVSFVGTEGRHTKILEDVHCVREWPGPGRQGDYSWKVPSRFAYGHENSADDSDDETYTDDPPDNCYGFEVTPEMKSYALMKLLLDPLQYSTFDDPSLTRFVGNGALTHPRHMKPVDLCADYLTEVARFAHKEMSKKLGSGTMRHTPIDFWITVPAVWSDKAKHDTLRAARKAALKAGVRLHEDSQCFLICEPEAAAVAALSGLTQGGSQAYVKAGDNVLVCDCGGGTVDLTTYEISATTPKLVFNELQTGIGGKCGSTWIDRRFMVWMEEKFGSAYTDLSLNKTGPTSRFMKEFEGYKRDFGKSNSPTKRYKLQLVLPDTPKSKHYDPDNSNVLLYNEDLKEMFDPVVSQIIDLLEEQYRNAANLQHQKPIDLILLVGGFGESIYLNDQLRAWCQQQGSKLICPEHAQSAVVRGAALSGLHEIQPTSRRSRRHYGFSLSEAFDRRRHRAEDAYIDEWDGRWKASGNMSWRLNKGDTVNEDTSIKFTFNSLIRDGRSSHITIYACDLDDAPAYVGDAGVYKLGEVHQAFGQLDLSQEPSKLVNGRLLNKVETKYTINFGHRRGVLVFSCSCQGKEIGNTTIQFDGQSYQEAADGSTNGFGDAHSSGCGVQ